MREPMWMYFLAVDADGVASAHSSKEEAIEYARSTGRAEYHVYRVDKWTCVWSDDRRPSPSSGPGEKA